MVISILNRESDRPFTGQEMAEFLIRNLKHLFKENKVDFAYLGGSWVRDVHQWWSDIDIFISVPNYPQLSSKTQLNFLTNLHVKSTDLTNYEEIEISVFETLPLHVQFNVFTNGFLIYEKNSDISSLFLEKLLPLYYDHMIWYNNLLKNQNIFPHGSEKNHD